ncbi:MAG: FAD-dependent oxidoreductase [Desulfobacterales bacterium]|jgi:NADH dehydrogenase FAD-containing subunit|nr:FAD-dependent oxidoreductase [Desulfobacterales bacterium]
MTKHLVLAGGGHAHMATLANIDRFIEKGHKVSLIGTSGYHYYSGMGPGMLGNTYSPEEIRFETRQMVEKKGGRFLQGNIVTIDADAGTVHLASGETVPYDVLSCNLGSHVPLHFIRGDSTDIYPVKPIESLLAAKNRILEKSAIKQISIGIIGGGPSAVEIAGNIHRLTNTSGMRHADIKILCSGPILPRSPDKVRKKVSASFQKRGIDILMGERVKEVRTGLVTEVSGKTRAFDIILLAVGVNPSPVFKASGIPIGPDGGMQVNRFLQSIQYDNIFGGGDCIWFQEAPLDKVGVYAVRQNPVLFHNLTAALDGSEFLPFIPQRGYLLIFNLGDGTGIFYKRPICFNGRIAFIIKDYIDRHFMRKFKRAM